MIIVYCNQCGKEVYRTRDLEQGLWDMLTEDKYFGYSSGLKGYSICPECRNSNTFRETKPPQDALPEWETPLTTWMNKHDESSLFVPKTDQDYWDNSDSGGTGQWGGAGPDCSSKGLVTPIRKEFVQRLVKRKVMERAMEVNNEY